MSSKKIITEIEKAFFERLGEKTSWGRNDIKNLYTQVQLEVLKENLDKKPEESTQS